jgi:cell division protein FtsL
VSGPAPHDIQALELALQISKREVTRLEVKIKVQKAQIKECQQECRDLSNIVLVLSTRIDAIMSKSNGIQPSE